MDDLLRYDKSKEVDYYKLLGCDELSTREQIECEYKRRALVCHPDREGGDERCFQLLLYAKQLLCDPAQRRLYDQWRRSGIAMPFDQFQRQSTHVSLHWQNTGPKKCMLTNDEAEQRLTDVDISNCNTGKPAEPSSVWTRSRNTMLDKFRNYQI